MAEHKASTTPLDDEQFAKLDAAAEVVALRVLAGAQHDVSAAMIDAAEAVWDPRQHTPATYALAATMMAANFVRMMPDPRIASLVVVKLISRGIAAAREADAQRLRDMPPAGTS